MCGPQQKECAKKFAIKPEHCLPPCHGLIVTDISADLFNQNETESLLGEMLEDYERYKMQGQDEVIFPEKLKSIDQNLHLISSTVFLCRISTEEDH